MDIVNVWPILKIILGIIFLIGCFVLIILLLTLAASKKKMCAYIDQINENGNITKSSDNASVLFDLSIMLYLFVDFPEIRQHKYSVYKEINELHNEILILSKIIKPTLIIFFMIVISLIILLNLLGQ